MDHSHNLYELLDVTENAANADIKKSFFKKVKEIGGPEKDPQKYKKLREAYDTLSNTASRSEYDSMSSFGDEINKLVNEAEDEWSSSSPNYNAIVKLLKKAVALGPDIGRLRNMLGLALEDLGSHDEALVQFEKAVKIYPEKPDYWLNAGHTSRSLKNYDKAKEYYVKAQKLDRENPSSYIALAYLYFDQKESDFAHLALDSGIDADGRIDFNDFTLYYHKIQLFFLEGKVDEADEIFQKIESIATDDSDKRYAAWMFVDLSYHLYEYNRFDLISKLTESAVKLDPENEHYQELYNSSKKGTLLLNQFKELQELGSVHEWVKEIISAYLAGFMNYINEDEFQKRIKDDIEWLEQALITYPDNKDIIRSLWTIKFDFVNLYDLKTNFFEEILSANTTNINFKEKCPYCSKFVIVPFHQYGAYTCPHCNKGIEYNSGIFYKRSSNTYDTTSDSDCFVATAVYKNPYHKNVKILRNWRDNYLKNFIIGRLFIKFYYQIGPKLAKIVSSNILFSKTIKNILDKFVKALLKSRKFKIL